MKRILRLTMLAAAFVGLSSTYAVAAKKVAYITKQKTMDATATACDNDPIIQMLKADQNLAVTVFLSDGATAIASLDTFDVLVIQESFGSGDNILKPTGGLALKTLPKPFVYNKTYSFRSAKALTTSSATAVEGPSLSVTVEASALANDLFKGCTIGANNEIAVVDTFTNDLGAPGVKSLNYTTGNVLSNTATLLAQPTGVTTSVISINDIPAGTTIDSETTLSRMITFGMNFGTISAKNGTNLTADGLRLWKNAVYILAGLEVTANNTTGLNNAEVNSKLVSEQYYTISGLQVQYPDKGIYIKKSTYENGIVKATKVVLYEPLSVH